MNRFDFLNSCHVGRTLDVSESSGSLSEKTLRLGALLAARSGHIQISRDCVRLCKTSDVGFSQLLNRMYAETETRQTDTSGLDLMGLVGGGFSVEFQKTLREVSKHPETLITDTLKTNKYPEIQNDLLAYWKEVVSKAIPFSRARHKPVPYMTFIENFLHSGKDDDYVLRLAATDFLMWEGPVTSGKRHSWEYIETILSNIPSMVSLDINGVYNILHYMFERVHFLHELYRKHDYLNRTMSYEIIQRILRNLKNIITTHKLYKLYNYVLTNVDKLYKTLSDSILSENEELLRHLIGDRRIFRNKRRLYKVLAIVTFKGYTKRHAELLKLLLDNKYVGSGLYGEFHKRGVREYDYLRPEYNSGDPIINSILNKTNHMFYVFVDNPNVKVGARTQNMMDIKAIIHYKKTNMLKRVLALRWMNNRATRSILVSICIQKNYIDGLKVLIYSTENIIVEADVLYAIQQNSIIEVFNVLLTGKFKVSPYTIERAAWRGNVQIFKKIVGYALANHNVWVSLLDMFEGAMKVIAARGYIEMGKVVLRVNGFDVLTYPRLMEYISIKAHNPAILIHIVENFKEYYDRVSEKSILRETMPCVFERLTTLEKYNLISLLFSFKGIRYYEMVQSVYRLGYVNAFKYLFEAGIPVMRRNFDINDYVPKYSHHMFNYSEKFDSLDAKKLTISKILFANISIKDIHKFFKTLKDDIYSRVSRNFPSWGFSYFRLHSLGDTRRGIRTEPGVYNVDILFTYYILYKLAISIGRIHPDPEDAFMRFDEYYPKELTAVDRKQIAMFKKVLQKAAVEYPKMLSVYMI